MIKRKFGINLSTFSTFFSLDNKEELKNVEKAYTEGIYADTPANRKLGRVGMSYKEWENKTTSQSQKNKEEKINNISLYRLGKLLNENDLYPTNIKDNGNYFLISFDSSDLKNKSKLNKIKEIFKKLDSNIYISESTHFIKAFKEKKDLVKEENFSLYKIGDFIFNSDADVLINKEGKKIDLTPRESSLLKTFVSNPNKSIPRETLLEEVWGESNYFNSRSMDVYITRLRNKLSEDKDLNLKVIPWQGYKLIAPKDKLKKISEKDLKNDVVENIIDKTSVLKKLSGKKLDNIIKYSNLAKEEGVKGIQVKDKADDNEKRKLIANFYIDNAELQGENDEIANDLDSIIEEALEDFVEEEKENIKLNTEKSSNEKSDNTESKEKKGNLGTISKKINDYFGFEDEKGDWFMNTPVSLMMANDDEFGDIINKFSNYKIISQSGKYKNNGSRSNMIGCNVSYKVIPKNIDNSEKEIKNHKKDFTIDYSTTIRDILNELGTI